RLEYSWTQAFPERGRSRAASFTVQLENTFARRTTALEALAVSPDSAGRSPQKTLDDRLPSRHLTGDRINECNRRKGMSSRHENRASENGWEYRTRQVLHQNSVKP